MRERIACGVLAFSGVLCAIIGAPGATGRTKDAVLLVLATGVFAARTREAKWTTPGRLLLLVIYAGLIVVSLLRAAHAHLLLLTYRVVAPQALMVILVVWLAVAALLSSGPEHERRKLCALLAPGVLTLTNLGLWKIGFHFPTDFTAPPFTPGNSELLGLIGINSPRHLLPLTSGLNSAGSVAAIALTIAVVIRGTLGRRMRRVNLLIVAGSIVTIAISDSRVALLAALLTLAALAVSPRFAKKGLAPLPFLLPVLPTAALWLLGSVAGYGASFSRNPGDFATATGRNYIWHTVFAYLKHPHISDMFGYGYFGQLASQVSYHYAFMFRGAANPLTASAHNLLLQTVLDIGYVGAAVLILLVFFALRSASWRYFENGSAIDLAIVAALVVMMLEGVTESIPSIYFAGAFAPLILLVCAGLRLSEPEPEPLPSA